MFLFDVRRSLIATVIILLAAAPIARAQTWTGADAPDNTWGEILNWDTGVPSTGNTALFNDTGAANASISLGGGTQQINTISFDSTTTAAYNLGVTTGDEFSFDPGGAITTSGTVATLQTISAAINGAGTLSVTNNATAPGGLTLAGNVTTADTLTLTSAGTGSQLKLTGSLTAPTLAVVANGTPATTQNAESIVVGPANISTAVTVSGTGDAAFNGIITGTGSLTMTHAGAVALNAKNTFSGNTTINMSAGQGIIRLGTSTDGVPGAVTAGPFGTAPVLTSGTLPARLMPIGSDITIANQLGTSTTGLGQGFFFESATAAIDPTGPHSLSLTGNIFTPTARTFTNNLVGGTLTIGLADGTSTITRATTGSSLTFQSQFQVQPNANAGLMVLNSAIIAGGTGAIVTLQNGIKATVNNTIAGNGSLVVSTKDAPDTVVHFNKTGMYTGTGNITIQNNSSTGVNGVFTTGPTVYFDQPNVFGATTSAFPTTSILTATGLGTTVYVNSPLVTNHRWDIEGDAVVYFNAPTTFNGTATSAFQVQGANARQQTAMVINSTLTKGPNAGSGVRVATGTLAGNGGTILSNVNILHSTGAIVGSYLAPGTPAISGGTNMTPAYKNGPGQLTITFGTGNALDFNGTSNCANCNFYAEIGGTTPGTQFDQVVVNGTAAIGTSTNKRAHLTVALINGYTRPAADTIFELIKATTLSPGSGAGLGFIDTTLPDANWSVQYGTAIANSLTVSVLGTGDFNHDNIVDAADYVVWRSNPAANGGDPGGYDTWRQNFGNTVPGSGSGLGGAATVPEPASMLLVFLAIAGLPAVRARRRG